MEYSDQEWTRKRVTVSVTSGQHPQVLYFDKEAYEQVKDEEGMEPFDIIHDGYLQNDILEQFDDMDWSQEKMEAIYAEMARVRIPATEQCLDHEWFKFCHEEWTHYEITPEGKRRKLRKVKIIPAKVETISIANERSSEVPTTH